MITHFAFQGMVGIGSFLALLSIFILMRWFRKKEILSPKILKILAISTPLGFIAVELGWIVTEVGRQPWIIYKYMKTAEALTPMPGIQYSFLFFTLMYFILGLIVSWLFYRQVKTYQEL